MVFGAGMGRTTSISGVCLALVTMKKTGFTDWRVGKYMIVSGETSRCDMRSRNAQDGRAYLDAQRGSVWEEVRMPVPGGVNRAEGKTCFRRVSGR